MKKNIFEGKWNEVKGKLSQNWGKLTDDDLTQIKGNNQEIFGKLEQHYGYKKEDALEAVNNFLNNEGYKSKESAFDAAEQLLEDSKKVIEDTYHSAEIQIVKALKKARKNPITSIMVAGAIGFVVSSLFCSKNKS